jgi:hypothetical protein
MASLAASQFGDPRWRLSNLYWITDKSGVRIKFQMNWAQEQLFNEMHYYNIVLKARQLGFTTFIDLFLLDQCVFNSNVRAGIIAHNLSDAKTIFRDKVKFPYDSLPDRLKGRIPAQSDTANELLFANNSSIRVGTSLRSGTLQLLHISEYGKMCAKYPEKAREVRTGALNTVEQGQLIFIESTAEGQSGHFYDLCEEAQAKRRLGADLTSLDPKFFFFPWWKHPEYTMEPPSGLVFTEGQRRYFADLERHGIALRAGQKEWYARKYSSQRDDMKREYPSTSQEAFEATVEGAYYGAELNMLESQGRIMPVPWDATLPVSTAWDLGLDDMTAIWFFQKAGLELRVIDYMEFRDTALTSCATEVLRKPYRFERHYMPHDVKVREMTTAKPRQEALESMGLKPISVTPQTPIEDGINAARNILPKCVFDAAACSSGLKALRNYHKEWDEDLGTFANKPKHDWSSHAADAFRMLALNISGKSEHEDRSQHRQTMAEDYDPLNYRSNNRNRPAMADEWSPF